MIIIIIPMTIYLVNNEIIFVYSRYNYKITNIEWFANYNTTVLCSENINIMQLLQKQFSNKFMLKKMYYVVLIKLKIQ